MKFALVSNPLPPSASGQAMVIYRLLKSLSPRDYCLISQFNYNADAASNNYSRKLSGKYYQLSSRFLIPRGHSFKSVQRANIRLGIAAYSKQIADIVRRENCGAIVACTDDLLHLPAARRASQMAKVPFYAYIFDDYSTKWLEPVALSFAQQAEPLLLKSAAGIIVPNEFMRDELRRRYKVEAAVIHNPCDLSEYEELTNNDALVETDGEIKIVYTGSIYDAHHDAFQNLIAAIKLLRQPNIKLHLYTNQLPGELEKKGICGPVIYHAQESVFAMPRIQKQANLLFLPLAFASPYPEVVRTSAPGKMGEYLAARRPILVHAPPRSFVAWYFRQHECGMVVDESDPAKLAQAIKQIITDANLQRRLALHAWEQAQADFSILVAQAAFAALMKLT